MSDGKISPLALTAGAGFYNNQGIAINSEFSSLQADYESTTLIGNLLVTLDLAQGSLPPGTGNSTSLSGNARIRLRTIGANVSGNYFPALGDSIPSNISVTIGNATINNGNITGNTFGVNFDQGMITLIGNVAMLTLGGGSFSRFAQGFAAAQGYIGLTNLIINSVNQSNRYLGPTFDNMDALITGDVSRINLALAAFGQDLDALGDTFALDQIGQFGTPAGLLSQLTKMGNMTNGTLPAVRSALIAQGLDDQDITNLVNLNLLDLFNPDGLDQSQFDSLQKQAYPALRAVSGADLAEVLEILGVTTPGLENMGDLLDPVKLFPNSYPSLTLPTINGGILIYNDDGTINESVAQILDAPDPGSSGATKLNTISIVSNESVPSVITITTIFAHGLFPGAPVIVDLDSGTNREYAEGSFFVTSVPNATTFTYTARPVAAVTGSLAGDVYVRDNSVPVPSTTTVLQVPRGCNDLAKIIPVDQALANRALQVGLAQIKNISQLTLPALAKAIR